MIDGFVKCGDIAHIRLVFYIVGCRVINGYVLLGNLDDACDMFDQMPERNLVSWTSILAGLAGTRCRWKYLQRNASS